MILLFTICSWHALCSIFDNLEVWQTFDGYLYYTELDYIIFLNTSSSSKMVSYYFDSTLNQTMVKRSMLTNAERYDRYALIFFAASYVIWHTFFAIWMYLYVYKRRRSMKLKDKVYLVWLSFFRYIT